ncbi:MAG TPA: hypothetical protein VGP21_07540 [Opitutaceae bacterium]|nr:hypothetical protein [Opitutaceae bacterium]
MKNFAKPSALRPPQSASAGAFTLLEILLSLALVMLVMVGLNTFIFSMGELWGHRSESRLLELHVRAVTRFLDQQLRIATLPPEAQASTTQPGAAPATPPVAVQEIRPQNGSSDNLLTFELPAGCRLFDWQGQPPLPDVICSLQVRPGEGLFLLWHSKLEKHFSDDPPREVRVTPFVTSMTYDYYDADSKRWQNETTLRRDSSNQGVAPQRLRLQFTYDKLTRESIISLATPSQGLPDY